MPSNPVRTPTTMRLPFAPSSVSVARQRLKAWMDGHAAESEAVEDARLVISELVANSVRHARPLADGQVMVAWTLEPRGLQVSVTDGGGRTTPRTRQSSASAVSGRGLAIVDVLAVDWWAETAGARSTVHAVLPV